MNTSSFLVIALFLCVNGLSAQKSVDFSKLVFEETDNNSLVYTQFVAKTSLSTPVSNDQKVFMDLGAGEALVFQAKDDQLYVEAEIVTSVRNEKKIAEDLRKNLDLSIKVTDDKVRLTSIFDYNDEDDKISNGFLSSPERRVNLKIYVPANRKIDLKDRSGDLEINEIENDIKIVDNSGGIRIDGLEGNLRLIDHSGEIAIKNVNLKQTEEMEIEIDDTSGAIYLTNARGETIIDDTSGEIKIRNLDGSLEIDDTSGGISAKEIKGNSKVDDTSGEITLVGIDGNVSIADSSGGIYVDDVSKDVTLRRDGSGSFTTRNIKGDVITKN